MKKKKKKRGSYQREVIPPFLVFSVKIKYIFFSRIHR